MPRALDSIRAELTSIDEDGLRRTLRVVEPLAGARARVAGRDAVVLCSNDYLGLAADPRFAAAARRALEASGTGAGAARLVTGTRPEHVALESEVVRLTGAPAALTFSSGFAANLAVLGALLGPEDLAVSDTSNHASLVDGLRLSGATKRVVPHRDAAAVREALRDAHRFRRVAVVTEGLFSMDGDVAPLADLLAAARAAGALLVVDDAHGFGVLGANGRGATEDLGPADDVIRVGTFGKAFGAAGAFVAGARDVVDFVLHRGRAFVFSTATPPSVAAAAAEAMRVAAAEPERRRRCLTLAARLGDSLRSRGVAVPRVAGPILPIVVGDAGRAVAVSERLLAEHAILVTPIRPPTVPAGSSRLRVSVSAALADEDVDRAAAALAAVLA
jgi:8-amino-7-oxononanoate synthase